MLINLLKKIDHWLLPPTCILCGTVTKRAVDLCRPCEMELPLVKTACLRCALPLSFSSTKENYCGQCLRHVPPFDITFAGFFYEKPMDYLITAFKFHQRLDYGRLLSDLLRAKISDGYARRPLPECIIPVPLHKERLQERGFNQALELAKPIARQFRLKLEFLSCERTQPTKVQSDLPANERQKNVKNAFFVRSTFHAKHVAILDDVMTTGYTVAALSQALRKAGVEQIDVWCCARTKL